MKNAEFEAASVGYTEGRKDTVLSYENMIRKQRSFYQKNNQPEKAAAMTDLLKIMGAERMDGEICEYTAKVKVVVEMTVTIEAERGAGAEAIDEAVRDEISATIGDEIDEDTQIEIKSLEQTD